MSVRFWAVVPAAGRGTRMGSGMPKQYLSVAGRTVAEHTLSRLLSFGRFSCVQVAIAESDGHFCQLPQASDTRIRTCVGGGERSDSVRSALAALAGDAADEDFVLVHDIARPCVRLSDVARLIDTVGKDAVGGILARRATDTVKQAGEGDRIAATLDRSGIWLAATPQMFRFGLLRDALAQAAADGVSVTDEAQAIERLGYSQILVECARDNIKITTPDDLALAAFWLQRQQDEART